MFGKRKRRAETDDRALALYYASDVHGSDQCWRKFLGAARFYKTPTLVMGGDLTGKAIVPVARHGDGVHVATFLQEERRTTSEAELDELLGAIRFNGFYPWLAEPAEIEALGDDPDGQAALFSQIMSAEVRRWVTLADERLDGTDTHAYVIAGNDDPWEIDDALSGATRVTLCDHRIVELGGHEMISSSYANPTPWSSPRELDEDALYDKLAGLAAQLSAPRRAIFNLHVPPYDSGLDTAAQINPDLTRVTRHGEPVEIPVGSRAVRQLIEEYQPLVSLHGHVHESRGAATIGRTLALNSGSEYNTGRLHGVRVVLDEDEVRAHQFVVG